MNAFDRAWALLKMPFVPGSVREGKLQEGDEKWEDRQLYEGDFYDPVDEKTRRLRINPTWKRRPDENKNRGRGLGSMFGGGAPKGTTVSVALPEDELKDPELLFGSEQQEPFAHFHRNDNLDRLFVPKHLRRRGIGTGMVDAMQEYREKVLGIPVGEEAKKAGWSQITDDSDDLQTEDMFRFWHKKGYMPTMVMPRNQEQTIGDEIYYSSAYGGRFDNPHPNWSVQGSNTEPFEVGWERAKQQGQYKLGAEQERRSIYSKCGQKNAEIAQKYAHLYPDIDPDEMADNLLRNDIIGDGDYHVDGGEYNCDCYAGHPWYEAYGENMALHEARKKEFPMSWGWRSLFDEDGDNYIGGGM